jgi:tungstate transport system substrate-binding protein
MAHRLWKRAKIHPMGDWFLKDESGNHLDFLGFAARHEAYLILGRIPVVMGKLRGHGMKILVDKDPTMRRPYIVMEANPAMFPATNSEGARALSDYLLSDKVQSFLANYGKDLNNGVSFFHPVAVKRGAAGETKAVGRPLSQVKDKEMMKEIDAIKFGTEVKSAK